MLKIKNILFPIDFSERCFSTVPFVESIASRYSASITLLSVAQPFYYAAIGDPGGLVGIDTDELMGELEARLGKALTKEFAGLPVERVAEIGEPAQAISEFARANHTDLVMMSTHGYGPFRSLLLGSITAKVLHDTECPVWTAAHMAESPCREHVACRNILCAVDGTSNSVELMKWAAELASDTGANLRLTHVVPGMEGFLSHQMDLELEADLVKEAEKTIQLLQESAGIHVPLCVAAGDVAEKVREAGLKHAADLIVIGRGVMQESLGRLRTHAYGIIRRAACPVLSV